MNKKTVSMRGVCGVVGGEVYSLVWGLGGLFKVHIRASNGMNIIQHCSSPQLLAIKQKENRSSRVIQTCFVLSSQVLLNDV